MKKAMIFFGWLLAFGMFACSPVRVLNTDSAKGFDLSEYQTFGFFDEGQISPEATAQVGLIQEEVARQLEKRGLTRSTSEPDLLVRLHLAVEEKMQTRQTNLISDPPTYIGQRRYTWRSKEVPVGKYQEGTVTVHLVDREQNKLVWQGVAEGVVSPNPKKLQRALKEGADVLFSQLPAQEVK
jgi:hypothetical protein